MVNITKIFLIGSRGKEMERREEGGEGGTEGNKREEERTLFNICNTFYFKLRSFAIKKLPCNFL